MTLNDWWRDLPQERYWMEITDREDLGGELIAPKIDEKSTPGYDLVSLVRPGDVVFHWSTRNGDRAFVGWSRVLAFPGTVGEYTWTPKNGETRTTEGWIAELTGFTELAEPISLADVRSAEADVLAVHEALEVAHGKPIYFPFYLYGGREIRGQQSYLVKFPTALFDVLPRLAAVADDEAGEDDVVEVVEDEPEEVAKKPRRVVPPGSVPRVQDPELRSALEKHAVSLAKAHYSLLGATKIKERGKPYDLNIKIDGGTRHVEVKGSSLRLESVALTRNEVEHARTFRTTDLFVVDAIDWVKEQDGSVTTSGGRVRFWSDWAPRQSALKIVSYSYALPTSNAG